MVKEDPQLQGMLFVGLDNGIMVSFNDGGSWMPLKLNLPPAPIYWLEIQEDFDDLVVATYGRGFYILDNVGAVREVAKLEADTDVALLPLREAYRFNSKESIKTDGPSLNNGRNPIYGADVNYFFKDTLSEMPVVQILDSDDKVIRTLKASNKSGLNRIHWDLRHEPTDKPKLRNQPPGRPWVELNGEGWRPLVTWDLDLMAGQFGPRVAPGDYTVKMVAGGKVYEEKLNVLKDPNANGSQEEIEEQVDLLIVLRDAMNSAVGMINDVELIRSQLASIIDELDDGASKSEALRLKKVADEVAGGLYDVHLTGAREDAFRSPMKLYGRLSALASDLTASGIDFAPTDQQVEVSDILDERLGKIKDIFDQLVSTEKEAFNSTLSDVKLMIRLPIKP